MRVAEGTDRAEEAVGAVGADPAVVSEAECPVGDLSPSADVVDPSDVRQFLFYFRTGFGN